MKYLYTGTGNLAKSDYLVEQEINVFLQYNIKILTHYTVLSTQN